VFELKKVKKILDSLPNLIKIEILRHYHSLYYYLKFKPDSATLNITDRCCFRCIMCVQWKDTNKEELATEEWLDIIKQLKNAGVKKITFSGGEPLLREDIVELVRYAKELGCNISLFTNGYLLTKKKAEELVLNGVNFISMSVDATNNNFEEIRGLRGSFKKIEESCETISEISKRYNTGASFSFLLMKPTLNYLKDVFFLIDKFNFPLVINLLDYTPYFFQIENKETLWINKEDKKEFLEVLKLLSQRIKNNRKSVYLNYVSLDYIRRYFSDPLQPHIPCFVSQQRICIDAKGNVFGGCWSMGSFGSLKNNTLQEIMRSEKYKMAHKRMFFKQCPGCSCGYITNLNFNLPTLLKEISLIIFPYKRDRFLKRIINE